jgi:NTE family protein
MKVGLALSGGGALGAAHIGVIEELEKAGIKPGLVCGSSAGAFIGLAYAIGGLEGLNEMFDEVSRSRLFKSELAIGSMPDQAFKFLTAVLKKRLQKGGEPQIPFACVATDIASGESKLLDKGDPVKNVLASAAYPGVFPIQKIGEKYYFDGGITRNLPAEETRSMGADFVIGSSIYSLAELEAKRVKKMNRLAALARSLDIYEKELSRFEEKECDFCFKPRTLPFRWFNFSKIETIKEIGRDHASKEVASLLLKLKNR